MQKFTSLLKGSVSEDKEDAAHAMSSVFCCYRNPEGFFWFGFVIWFFGFVIGWLVGWLVLVFLFGWLIGFFVCLLFFDFCFVLFWFRTELYKFHYLH